MTKIKQAVVCVVAALGFALPAVHAQVSSTLTHTFPFGACMTTASDDDTIFMGSGAGIYVLNGSSDEPAFVTTPSGVKSRLHAGGFVREISVSDVTFPQFDGHLHYGHHGPGGVHDEATETAVHG